MENRKIKNEVVSLLGMGCMRLPLIEGTKEIDIKQTEEMVALSIQKGITYFDTAYPYHDKKSELVMGEILKKYDRNSFTLANKLPIWECKTLDEVKAIFELQLQKCQVEYFDFYLCHALDYNRFLYYKELNVFPYLLELKKQGKIRHLGFSFHDAAQNIIPILDELDWDFCQIQFNYLDYDMQNAKLQYEEITKRNISVVVMEPVRGGMLANVCDEAKEILLAREPNRSIASWALRYVASFPNVKVILSGMSNLEQLEDNLNTFNSYKELDETDKAVLEKAKKAILGNNFIPCTGCRYCMPCPFGVNIPRVFANYNHYGIKKDIDEYKERISRMNESERADKCKSCKACMKHCPQHIQIPDEMKKISQL